MNQSNFFKMICLTLAIIPLSTLAAPATDLSRFVENGFTTFDTATGLEWLELQQTNQDSYYRVLDRIKPGEQYDGFRYATGGEVSELFDAFDLPFFTGENTEGAEQFMDLFGLTDVFNFDGGFTKSARGMVEPGVLEDEHPLVPMYGISVVYRDSGFNDVTVNRGTVGANPALSHYRLASFIVRNHGRPHTVPEINGVTAPIALSIPLLMSLAGWERRRAVKS